MLVGCIFLQQVGWLFAFVWLVMIGSAMGFSRSPMFSKEKSLSGWFAMHDSKRILKDQNGIGNLHKCHHFEYWSLEPCNSRAQRFWILAEYCRFIMYRSWVWVHRCAFWIQQENTSWIPLTKKHVSKRHDTKGMWQSLSMFARPSVPKVN